MSPNFLLILEVPNCVYNFGVSRFFFFFVSRRKKFLQEESVESTKSVAEGQGRCQSEDSELALVPSVEENEPVAESEEGSCNYSADC